MLIIQLIIRLFFVIASLCIFMIIISRYITLTLSWLESVSLNKAKVMQARRKRIWFVVSITIWIILTIWIAYMYTLLIDKKVENSSMTLFMVLYMIVMAPVAIGGGNFKRPKEAQILANLKPQKSFVSFFLYRYLLLEMIGNILSRALISVGMFLVGIIFIIIMVRNNIIFFYPAIVVVAFLSLSTLYISPRNISDVNNIYSIMSSMIGLGLLWVLLLQNYSELVLNQKKVELGLVVLIATVFSSLNFIMYIFIKSYMKAKKKYFKEVSIDLIILLSKNSDNKLLDFLKYDYIFKKWKAIFPKIILLVDDDVKKENAVFFEKLPLNFEIISVPTSQVMISTALKEFKKIYVDNINSNSYCLVADFAKLIRWSCLRRKKFLNFFRNKKFHRYNEFMLLRRTIRDQVSERFNNLYLPNKINKDCQGTQIRQAFQNILRVHGIQEKFVKKIDILPEMFILNSAFVATLSQFNRVAKNGKKRNIKDFPDSLEQITKVANEHSVKLVNLKATGVNLYPLPEAYTTRKEDNDLNGKLWGKIVSI